MYWKSINQVDFIELPQIDDEMSIVVILEQV